MEALIFHSEEESVPDSIAKTSHVTWGRPVCLLGMVSLLASLGQWTQEAVHDTVSEFVPSLV